LRNPENQSFFLIGPEFWQFPQQEELHHPCAHFHDITSSKYYQKLAKNHIVHLFVSFLTMWADISMFPHTSEDPFWNRAAVR
jgi:hypothetical protein